MSDVNNSDKNLSYKFCASANLCLLFCKVVQMHYLSKMEK